MGELAARLLAALSRPGEGATDGRYLTQEAYARSEYEMASYLLPLLTAFAPKVRGRALDLGSGQGGATERYAEALAPAIMLGIDFDREKVRTAGRLWHRSRFVAGSATTLPFRNESIDCIVSHDGFEHFMDPEAVLGDAQRILKPGGRFLISFAPYYTSKGPHLEHYITIPYAHLLLSRATVARAAELVGTRQLASLPEAERESRRKRLEFGLWQARECVNEMSIKRWERMLLGGAGYEIVAYRKYVDRRIYRLLLSVGITQELVASVFTVLEKRPGARLDRQALRRAQQNSLPEVLYHH